MCSFLNNVNEDRTITYVVFFLFRPHTTQLVNERITLLVVLLVSSSSVTSGSSAVNMAPRLRMEERPPDMEGSWEYIE